MIDDERTNLFSVVFPFLLIAIGNINKWGNRLLHHSVRPADIPHFPVQCHCLIVSPPDHGVIRSDRVFDAMLATDRGLYSTDYPYADSPQSIGTHFSHYLWTHALDCQ